MVEVILKLHPGPSYKVSIKHVPPLMLLETRVNPLMPCAVASMGGASLSPAHQLRTLFSTTFPLFSVSILVSLSVSRSLASKTIANFSKPHLLFPFTFRYTYSDKFENFLHLLVFRVFSRVSSSPIRGMARMSSSSEHSYGGDDILSPNKENAANSKSPFLSE